MAESICFTLAAHDNASVYNVYSDRAVRRLNRAKAETLSYSYFGKRKSFPAACSRDYNP